jgi:CDP-glycerol glycerophosphotransferase (TagB/SpsB family)
MKKYLFYISQLYSFSIVRPLQKAIIEKGDHAAWFLEDFERLSPFLRPDEAHLKSVSEVKAYDPAAVFVPGNMVPDFFPGIKVELFHGFHARKRSNERGHFRIRNFFDLYCTQGPDTTGPFQELAGKLGFFEVKETGWPKMDPLFTKDTANEIRKDRPVILLTSTFTPRLSAALILFETIRRLAQTNKWKWVVNFHPKMDAVVVNAYQSIQSDNFRFIETDDIVPLIKTADLMVSDTSSVISEFLLLHKPVVTFNNRSPGSHLINITDPSDLESAIETGLSRPDSLMNQIRAYSDWIHPYRDGRSSVRVLEATNSLIDRGRGHLKKKPLNLMRRLKIRKQLGYYWL